MDNEIYTEPADWIVEQARLRNRSIKKTQLQRWHDKDVALIQPPHPVPLRKGRGTQSVYPTGTLQRVIALHDILKRTRNFEAAGWALWLHYDFDVSEVYWKPYLIDTAQWYESWRIKISRLFYGDKGYEITDKGFDAINEFESVPLKNNPFNKIRMAVRFSSRSSRKPKYNANSAKANFETFMIRLIEIATGKFRAHDASIAIKRKNIADEKLIPDAREQDNERDGKTLDKAFGFDRAKSDKIGSVGPVMVEPTEAVLKRITKIFKTSFNDVLAETTDATLMQAHHELAEFMNVIANANAPLEKAYGKNAFGFGLLVRIFYGASRRVQALMFLGWLVLRKDQGNRKRLLDILALKQNVEASCGR